MRRATRSLGRRRPAEPRSRCRVRRARLSMRLMVLFALALSTPNLMELVEDVAHYVADGHTPHDAGHEHEHGDHCCTGLFHVCLCHAPAFATAPPALPALGGPAEAAGLVVAHERGGPLTGFLSPPFRPPRA